MQFSWHHSKGVFLVQDSSGISYRVDFWRGKVESPCPKPLAESSTIVGFQDCLLSLLAGTFYILRSFSPSKAWRCALEWWQEHTECDICALVHVMSHTACFITVPSAQMYMEKCIQMCLLALQSRHHLSARCFVVIHSFICKFISI
jgi:hypothetical protein